MSATGLAHDDKDDGDDDDDNDDDDDDNDGDVHVFNPMGDGPLFLLILLVFMVTVSLILFI